MVCDSTACVDFGFLIRAERARANPTTRPVSVRTVGRLVHCVCVWLERSRARRCALRASARVCDDG